MILLSILLLMLNALGYTALPLWVILLPVIAEIIMLIFSIGVKILEIVLRLFITGDKK